MIKQLALIAATAVVGSLAASAGAAPLVSCPADFTLDGTAKVAYPTAQTAASACQIDQGTSNSTVASIANINTSAFFGFSNWQDNGQTQIAPGNGQSGTWAINNVNFAARDYIMVFKDGNGTSLTAFFFNEEASSGTWTSPFTQSAFPNAPGNNTKDVSHYTIAYRLNGTPPPVPEPATLGLLGLGILGIAAGRRRKA